MGRSIVAVAIGYLIFAASAVVLFRVTGVDPKVPPTADASLWSPLAAMLVMAPAAVFGGSLRHRQLKRQSGS